MDWHKRFEKAVKNQDIEAGKALFSEGVVSFGTRTDLAQTLEELVEKQWSLVWPASKDFSLVLLHELNPNPESKLLVCKWKNWTEINRSVRYRHGRATFLLQSQDGDFKCVHSHFSESVEKQSKPRRVIR